jgi:hypothetical protein
MAVEVQIRSAVFLAAQLRRVQAMRLCPPPPYELLGRRIQVQRVEPLPGTIRRTEYEQYVVFQQDSREPEGMRPFPADGVRPQIVQPVQVDVCDLDQLLQGGEPEVVSFRADLIIGFRYIATPGGSCYLQVGLDDIELPGLPTGGFFDAAAVEDELRELVQANLPALPSVPFDFASLLWPNVAIANAAATVEQGLGFVAFRAEPALALNPVTAWTNFGRGAIVDRLGGADWALFVDGRQLAHRIATEVELALKQAELPAAIRVNSVGATYGADGRIRVAAGIIVDAGLLGEHFEELGITLELGVDPATGEVLVDLHLDEVQELIDRVRSAVELVSAAVLGPLLFLVLELAFGEQLDRLSGLLGSLPVPGGVERISPTHYRARQAVPALAADLPARAVRCDASEHGIAVVGTLAVEALTPSVPTVAVAPFAWTASRHTCSELSDDLVRRVKERPDEHGVLHAEIELGQEGSRPIGICGIEVLDGGAGGYPTELGADGDVLPAKISIDLGPLSASSPMRVLVRTTAGLRLAVLGPPQPLTDEDRNMIRFVVASQLADCPQKPLDLQQQLEALIVRKGRLPDPPRPDIVPGGIDIGSITIPKDFGGFS